MEMRVCVKMYVEIFFFFNGKYRFICKKLVINWVFSFFCSSDVIFY